DEMVVDPDYVNGFPISEIAMVKVIKGYFVGGFGGGGGGAIAIYRRKPGMKSANVPAFLNSTDLSGYEKWKDYPNTNYNESYYRTLKKDTREVLLWQPLSTSNNDDLKVPIEFYNNDVAKQFRLIIVGITPEGQPVFFDSIVK